MCICNIVKKKNRNENKKKLFLDLCMQRTKDLGQTETKKKENNFDYFKRNSYSILLRVFILKRNFSSIDLSAGLAR